MEDSRLRIRESTRRKIHAPAQGLDFLGILIFIFSLFSLPFPFVRQIWLQSVIGALGFVNSGLLIWLASRIRKLNYSAAVAGFGLVFHEQLLTWQSFWTLNRDRGTGPRDMQFLAINITANLVLAFLFLKCLPPLKEFSKSLVREFYMTNKKPLSEKASFFQNDALAGSVLSYGLLILAFLQSRSLDLKMQFSACKIIGELICVIGFYGVGREFELYFQEIQTKSVLAIKVFSHFLVMGGVLWTIYRIMPLDPFLK